jgi:hypothetical protein
VSAGILLVGNVATGERVTLEIGRLLATREDLSPARADPDHRPSQSPSRLHTQVTAVEGTFTLGWALVCQYWRSGSANCSWFYLKVIHSWERNDRGFPVHFEPALQD